MHSFSHRTTVLIETTYRCNEKCIHCYLNGCRQDEMNLSTWIEALKYLSNRGVKLLIISGGEPLLYESIEEIIVYSRLLGMVPFLFTNGLLLKDKVSNLHKSKICHICISLYGATKENHEIVTQTKGSFVKTIDGLMAARENNIPVEIRMIVMKHNINDVNSISKLAKSVGAKLLLDYEINPTLNFSDSPMNVNVQIEENKLIEWKKKKIKVVNPVHKCTAGREKFVISPNGTIFPCTKLRIPIGKVVSSETNGFILNTDTLDMLDLIRRQMPGECMGLHYLNHKSLPGFETLPHM